MIDVSSKPDATRSWAEEVALEQYGLRVTAEELNGERDQNFLLFEAGNPGYILKVANLDEPRSVLEFQNTALERLEGRDKSLRVPSVVPRGDGESIVQLTLPGGESCWARLLRFVPGRQLAEYRPYNKGLLLRAGSFLGRLDQALSGFGHPAAHRPLQWDALGALNLISDNLGLVFDQRHRKLIGSYLRRFEAGLENRFGLLRQGVIHNDGNDHNFLVGETPSGEPEISGLLDFGDMIFSAYANEPAVAAAYAMMDQPAPLLAGGWILGGFHAAFPLEPEEIDVVYELICLRLCTSVTLAALQRAVRPGDAYLSISQPPAWRLLKELVRFDPNGATAIMREAAGISYRPQFPSTGELLSRRKQVLGPSLSLSYREPLHIVRGLGVYLYTPDGRPYLDAVNNVAHVGHCHPRVVEAGQRQMALLNTNTRYLHHIANEYAGRLLDRFPEPLRVCYFVCSGSEANELALRLARAHTGGRDMMVLRGAYHGNSSALIAISPYKYRGPGGAGQADSVHELATPDLYRARHRAAGAGEAYAHEAEKIVEELAMQNRPLAGFIAESILGCAGQIPLPAGYLRQVYSHVRKAGGVCIADEVQTGFGRIGSHYWGFEAQDVTPDIVTLGKPMGNGHPLAAVITTREIADSFDNGMEYFNTFGGNPVSCAIGMAVLEVIDEEGLQDNAVRVGGYLRDRLVELSQKHACIGDVRGSGLFLGVELVRDRHTLEPAGSLAGELVERMKDAGVLVSTDGPFHNVIKIKPPLVFSKANTDLLTVQLDRALQAIELESDRYLLAASKPPSPGGK